MADYTIVTSNCPRFESLEEINAEIQVGLDRTDGKYEIIPDRRTAIKAAMKMAQPNDMVLLIGKGHWDYEEINGVKYPFDDRQVCREFC
jgi:UDP-N-acetylmuramoyl-L-alanyl-D-glutamate--2,6-diaminopimelate ligase